MTNLIWANHPLWTSVVLFLGYWLVTLIGLCGVLICIRREWAYGRWYTALVATTVAMGVVSLGHVAIVLAFLPRDLWFRWGYLLPVLWALPVAGFMAIGAVRRRSNVSILDAVALGALGWGVWVTLSTALEILSFLLFDGSQSVWYLLAVLALALPTALLVRRLPVRPDAKTGGEWTRIGAVIGILIVVSMLVLFPQVPVGTSYPTEPEQMTNESVTSYVAEYDEMNVLASSGPGTADCQGSVLPASQVERQTIFRDLPRNFTYVRLSCELRQRAPPGVNPFRHDSIDIHTYSKLYATNGTVIDDFCNERVYDLTCPPDPPHA